MPIETASLFFPCERPMTALARLLRALADKSLLADRSVDADADALKDEPMLASLFGSGRAALEDVLHAFEALASQGAPRLRFFYLRIAAPEAWPSEWRRELEARLGEQPAAPDGLVHIHPYEVVLALDLADLDGAKLAQELVRHRQRLHPHLPASMRVVDDEGDAVQARAGFELRCPPETVGVLAYLLDKCALIDEPVLVRVLD